MNGGPQQNQPNDEPAPKPAEEHFDETKEKFKNELTKEEHRRNLEKFAAAIIAIAFLVSAIGLFVYCGDGSSRSWFQTIFTTILGAAIAYALKKDR